MRVGAALHEDVALVVEVDDALDQLVARVVADRDEQAGDRQLAGLAGLGVAQRDAAELGVAVDRLDRGVPGERDLGVVDRARSAMILLARSSSRRWTIVTERANLVRKVASSTAESPPPTTAMSWSRKKKPSQVAHQETPWPESRFSSGRPSSR